MRSLLLTCAFFAVGCATWTSSSTNKPTGGGTGNTGNNANNQVAPQRSDLQAIADLEDRRSLGDGRLMQTAISERDPLVRKRAFLALGRLQDPNTAGAMVEGLSDPDPGVRGEAAFAIGLLGLSWAPLADDVKTRLTTGLLEKEAAESDGAVKLAMLEAMGRVATPQLVDRIVDRLNVAGDVQGRAALSLGVAARAKTPIPARAYPALALLLKKENAIGSRYGGAFALLQTKKPEARPYLLICASDDASEIRALCAKGLGAVGTEVDAVTLKKLIDDPDYRVAVEATRSLAQLAAKCKSAACPAIGALTDLNFRVERLVRGDTAGGGQPLLALAQSGLPASGKALIVSLRSQLNAAKTATDQKTKMDAANLDCRFAAALDRIGGSITEVMNCGHGLIEEPRRLALGLQQLAEAARAGTVDGNKLNAEVGSFVYHTDPRVKLAAVELLGELKTPAAQEKVRSQLLAADLVLAAAAAASSANLGDKTQIPTIRQLAQKALTQVDIAPTIAEALAKLDAKDAISDLEGWLKSPNATIRQSAADALTKLKGAPVSADRVETPQMSQRPQLPPKNAKLMITTEKGEFEIALYTEDAPLTSANLFTLARKGYFRGLTFHRVVPDFVAQGGDPRGDGNGGPGYTIRCEVNHKPYARGVVGMALSGKDTGGSQFFVTAAPQPHLDGRYTAFGEVTKGQEVVDALLEGDKIVEVRASP
ncbi:MAG: peptidylprolyl isomerase [Archangium sp.]|nr:peptidylprolyl isomerase [Archangium sp.]